MPSLTASPNPSVYVKNKSIATWLAFITGPLGLHRFYLHGLGDWLGWLHPIAAAFGLYGIQRVREFGIDDHLSWLLIPIFGFNYAACALTAIIYGLTDREKWNARFGFEPQAANGSTHWFTIFAVAGALMVGSTLMISSIVYSFQRYFEVQIDEARKISQ
jgi:hypothetical protein